MAAPGWYPDVNAPGTLRWWDGDAWSDHTMSAAPTTAPSGPADQQFPSPPRPPVPPAPQPNLRPDGTLKGPSFRAAMVVLGTGIAMVVAAVAVMVPAFVDTVNGPRFDVPGSHTLSLDGGTWMLYERNGGFAVRADNVTVDGPGPVEVRPRSAGVTETITRGNTVYTAVVRLEVGTPGEYTITVGGESASEALVARPLTDLFSYWPWIVILILGVIAVIVGCVLWAMGASNRRNARRAGL